MAKLEAKISITETDLFESFIALIAKYEDELPNEMRKELSHLFDCEYCEIGAAQLHKHGLRTAEVYADGQLVNHAYSVNPVLKRVITAGGVVYPKHLKMVLPDGSCFVEW